MEFCCCPDFCKYGDIAIIDNNISYHEQHKFFDAEYNDLSNSYYNNLIIYINKMDDFGLFNFIGDNKVEYKNEYTIHFNRLFIINFGDDIESGIRASFPEEYYDDIYTHNELYPLDDIHESISKKLYYYTIADFIFELCQ